MFKVFLMLIISLTLLQATPLQDRCSEDMSKMFSSYYKADRDKLSKNFIDSIDGYKTSINSAYLALESCKKNSDYDFNIMYNFIQESEKNITSISY